LNFEYFLSLEIQLYYKDWFWKKEKLIVCQVCSHLSQMVEGTLVINPSDDGYIGIGLADDYIRSYIISSSQNKFQ